MRVCSCVSPFLWPAVVVLAIGIYLQGVSGPFLFDDFANLDALGDHGGVDSWKSLWLYLLQGDSGPTGRPIALLSFLINDNNWPSSPAGFKYTNILIHSLNGCLLFWLQYRIFGERIFALSDRQRFSIAFLSSFFWLFHPIFVSTVLYVVQRMAMLAATFVLAGVLSHVYFRSRIGTRPAYAYWGMTFSLGFWGLLALLSKENGALLPVLILVLELTVYANSIQLNRLWRYGFLILPTLCIVGYLVYVPIKNGLFSHWSSRGFSPYERLITEARILWEYLFHLYTFRGSESGLFHDGHLLSKSLFSPPTTLFSVVGVLVLGLFSIFQRKKWPLLSLAFLFYLAGHLVESTSLGLELYFEHRNYLPSFFLFVPLAWVLMKAGGWLKPVVVSVLCMAVILLLFVRVDLWANPVSLALAWARESPESVRAQRSAAIALTQAGRPVEALYILNNAFSNHSESHALLMHRILVKCSLGERIEKDKGLLLELARKEPFNPKLTNLMEVFVGVAKLQACRKLDLDYAGQFIFALLENPVARKSGGFRHQLYYFLGVVRSYEKRAYEALDNFSRAIALRPEVGVFMQSIAVLASDGHCEAAIVLAQQFKGDVIYNGNLSGPAKKYYQKEFLSLLGEVKNNCQAVLNL